MRTIKLILEYDGTNYHGWQRQKGHSSIQEEIEKALHKLTGKRTPVTGAGRTDAGVHALGQVASFSTAANLSEQQIVNGLNALLPKDIAIRQADEVRGDFHPQKCAKWKTYRYLIRSGGTRPAVGRYYVSYLRSRLDLVKMKRAARYLLGRHDFRAFATQSRGRENTVRTIRRIEVKSSRGNIGIEIEGDGFLYNMVRVIVGTLVQVGLGKMPPSRMRQILSSRDRRTAGPTAPAAGLVLLKVDYGESP